MSTQMGNYAYNWKALGEPGIQFSHPKLVDRRDFDKLIKNSSFTERRNLCLPPQSLKMPNRGW
ncbi:hypothetical protein OAK98_06085, partial [Mariniblastus sp.]|nr:hypothetical protein [Mariniblastus sp.]